jgi:acyl-CoA reductase-like NAD-dependent aldehyde dehydrogenase
MTWTTKLLINGELIDGDERLEIINPATAEVFHVVGRASAAQAEHAIAAAKAAQPGWAATDWAYRRTLLLRYADSIRDNAKLLAEVVVLEQGKPLHEAEGEVAYTEMFVRSFAEMTSPGHSIRDDHRGKIDVYRRPLGVVVGISAWNFPIMVPAAKLAPALMMGNTVILKPAPTTPISNLMLGELAAPIFPPGVVNVITDQNDLGSLLTSHPDVAKVTFTGSTATGRKIMASSAPTLKRLTLELGGNDAAIVLADADVEHTAKGIHQAAFYNAGQACLAVKRVYAEDRIYDELCDAITAQAAKMRVGAGLDPNVDMGPIQNNTQFGKACDYLAIAGQDGTVTTGGLKGNGPGFFVQPTVVKDIDDDSRLVTQEQFCPVLPIIRVTSAEDGLARANRSQYGLGGSIWAGDRDRARKLAGRMEAGTVWINQHLDFGPHIPFGGAKQSGIGVEWTELGLEEFGQVTVVNEAGAGS